MTTKQAKGKPRCQKWALCSQQAFGIKSKMNPVDQNVGIYASF